MSTAKPKEKELKKVVVDETKVFKINHTAAEPIRDQSN
jgi:hypothetical protein